MALPFSRTTRALGLDSARPSLLLLASAGVALICWLVWLTCAGVTVYEVSRSARLESGAVPHEVSSPSSGRLAAARLELGREVKAGDVLVELDATAETLRLREEEVRLAAYPAEIAALRSQIAALTSAAADDRSGVHSTLDAARARVREAAAAADFARDEEQRLRAESGAGSVAEIDALRAGAEARKALAAREALVADALVLEREADKRAHQAVAQIEALNRDVLVLEGEEATTKATLALLREEIERHRVRSPVDGSIGEVLPAGPGAYVAQGQKLATIVPRSPLRIVAAFNPATALGRLKPGQTARLRLDGYPWVQFGSVEARVVQVAAEPRDNSLRVELVPATATVPPGLLRHGLTGTLEVRVETVTPAVLLMRVAGQLLATAVVPTSASAP